MWVKMNDCKKFKINFKKEEYALAKYIYVYIYN